MKKQKTQYNRSLLFKVLAIYFLIFAVPIIFLYSSLQRTSQKMTQNEAVSQLLSSLNSISNTMDEVFRSVNYVQAQLQGNTAFSDECFLLQEDQASQKGNYENYRLRQHLGMELYKLYLSNPYLNSLELYSVFGNTLFANYLGETRQIVLAPSSEQINRVVGKFHADSIPKASAWYLLTEDSGETLFPTYSRPYCSYNPYMFNYSRATISLETLQEHLNIYNPNGDIQFYIHPDSDKRVHISGSNLVNEMEVPDCTPGEDSGWVSFTSQGVSCIMVYFYSQYTGWYYSAAVPLKHYNVSEPLITEYWYYISAALAIIFILTALFVSLYLIQPMKKVSNTMRKAEHGNLDVRVDLNRRDELGYIGHRLNVLLEHISSLIHTNYETRLLKEGYELKFIQTQLKEHFIYNTMDYIHWIADKHNVPEISNIIFNLSRFFRLTLNNGSDYISVEQEAESLKSYMFLYNMRLDKGLNGTVRVADEIKEERVIKYFFQPILENAIIHGLYPIGGGDIDISFSLTPSGRLCYCVKDNGAGISPLDLNDINLCIQDDRYDGKYFALVNLNRQMRLYFGNDFSFEITSSPGQGTTVKIEFPRESEAV